MLSGRADFVLADSIDECKASFSKDAVTNAMNGKPKTEHLAQLVCYLLEFQLTRGRLVYGFYQQRRDGTFERTKVAYVYVQLDGETILVNGADSGYKTSELVNSIVQLGKYLNSDLPAPRPSTAANFISPCKYCPLKDLCNRIDAEGKTITESKDEAKLLIVGQQGGPVPKPTKVKV